MGFFLPSSAMPSYVRHRRQTDYHRFSSSTPIVIDNGSSRFRIGWAGESDPRIDFRSLVQRPRHKATGETVTIVGDHDPWLMKYFDCTRSSFRSPFDFDVVYQFDFMESIFDFGFERLGSDDSQVDHPILMTECICNPIFSRCRMAELLFETYGVPSIAFGVDAAFSYKYNQQLGVCNEYGLALCSGSTTSHAIPFVNGEPAFPACSRTNIGGYHVTDYLKQLLSLKHPHLSSNITWEKAEELKIEHCYVALDYTSELQLFQKESKEAEDKTRFWQLPWVPPPQEEPPSEEELARKAALKERQGQRLREMAAAKKVSRIADLEHEIDVLDSLLYELDNASEEEISSKLAETKYSSRQDLEAAYLRVRNALRKAKGEPAEPDEKIEASLDEKYPLVNVPDDNLTPEQLKEKKKQLFLKTTTEGRLRAKQKMIEERMERDRQLELEEERRLENPELYLDQLRTKYKELSEKMEQRKKLKTNGNGYLNTPGAVGRGERLNAAQRERMRLLTTAAFDRGKGEDTFGSRDEDWQLYKLMSKDNDDGDEGIDQNEEELARVASRLQEIDPEFVSKTDVFTSEGGSDLIQFRPVGPEDFKIVLGVERSRCPEILFQPSMVGVDQGGLHEMVGVSLRRFRTEDDGVKDRISNSILLTGGSTLFPGLAPRLEAEIRKLRPFLSPVRVVMASNPILDAWRGAAVYAAASNFHDQTFDKHDYYEKGEDWLRRYQITYTI